ncbi:uncharacterized protein BDR25DRAFT_363057 [Lindgomyces ingoldianus]|uniref:Uncharacterized protein n=1 Tax=Lindgomyces ingoldianus TaxID=673940 RepID=A0ACB6Q8E7_9PLEO|nr:uncharacterized protein BDR25DRAFT_363057 [Lindgomyces ingoldianus]KAF2463149.1 hypothetical protein BDR25DRAFT_363057 [Lindgomyces ingoldianus]
MDIYLKANQLLLYVFGSLSSFSLAVKSPAYLQGNIRDNYPIFILAWIEIYLKSTDRLNSMNKREMYLSHQFILRKVQANMAVRGWTE